MKTSKNYTKLTDKEKKQLIYDLYYNNNMSYAVIAEKYGTYPNRIRRDAKKFNIKPRNKSQAQKNALETGTIKHPTQGKLRTEEEKDKIGMSMYNHWKDIDDDERESRREKSRDNWFKIGDDKRKQIADKATEAVREASVKGSKLEHFLLEALINDGYKVDFHKEQTLANTRLQIDLFLTTMNIAIEVDGLSHFAQVWGQKSLDRNKRADAKKTGLILGKGWKIVRIKHDKDFSKAYAKILYSKLIGAINELNTTNKTNLEITE